MTGHENGKTGIPRLQSENECLHLPAISSQRLAVETEKARDRFAEAMARIEMENAECKPRSSGPEDTLHSIAVR